MQRTLRDRPQGMFQGAELRRLLTMVAMLGVLLLLILRASDPNTWTWLLSDAAPSKKGEGKEGGSTVLPGKQGPERSPRRENSSDPFFAAGPTDQDPEEKDAADEEFQAISDGTLSIRPEEMPAYKRLWHWVRSQPLASLRQRARNDVTFNDLYQTPDRYRGQLIALDLNVRRILRVEEGLDGIPLYEVWGFTTQSKSWPYVAVVMDLPQGMPIGANVEEQATVVGYFLKTQGYHEADAKPNARPLRAPLLIGRLIWHPDRAPQAQSTDWTWAFLLMLGFLVLIMLRWGVIFLKETRRAGSRQPYAVSNRAPPSLDDWLAEPSADDQKGAGTSRPPPFPPQAQIGSEPVPFSSTGGGEFPEEAQEETVAEADSTEAAGNGDGRLFRDNLDDGWQQKG